LINNAGAVTPRPGRIHQRHRRGLGTLHRPHLMAAVRTSRAALPQMTGRGGGSIVTISSVNACLPDPLVIDYSAKAALTNFCKSLSKELGPPGSESTRSVPGRRRPRFGSGPR
jgi:NAD(P)-dependent dehydrogenase (short-subunit alcohol dehydrogenase family)